MVHSVVDRDKLQYIRAVTDAVTGDVDAEQR